ncbi:unnamed protein product [Parascedosporium putredinis]|uniref:Uncharacterized protein n=1 Tax=Parascedosporium putredinis TaxID=1442378 RepID=A0A9P1GWI5_9PEZI|nr:unnamed protein product [Parascedosporium putredinis]CAI7988274.1 unnamed protein product [Parascedosporium putredinis]
MSNAKYTAAPTQDPDEEYAQAPPSYQAADAGSSSSSAPLFSGPRSSEDNIPDDFKVREQPGSSHPSTSPLYILLMSANHDDAPQKQFGGSVAEATIDIRNQFVRKVYAILSVQLIATTALSSVSFFSTGYKQWIQSNPTLLWISLLGSMVFMGLTYWKRKSYPTNLAFLAVFTALEAYTISFIVSFYDVSIVLNALIITAGIFVFLTAFACQTKYDFTSWIPYACGALWALVMFSFVYLFLPQSKTTDLFLGFGAALLFSVYILIDTQLIMRKLNVEEEIAAAISLYLDIINLFLAILRILNNQNN